MSLYKSMISSVSPKVIIAVSLFFLLLPGKIYAQVTIRGKVMEEDSNPVPYASIKLLKQTSGSVTDTAGNFSLRIASLKENDTLLISSVGYESLKTPVSKALKNHEFTLKANPRNLEAVVVRSFSKEDVAGAKIETVGFYRSWSTEKRGGEIGREIVVSHKEYQVAKVRFKIYSSCDTSIIRLHIREFIDGRPGEELLKDSIAQTINNAAIADKAYEFDLNKYNIILTNNNIFVSFEVLKGSRSDSTTCSFAFVGSEPGIYQYRSRWNDGWSSTNDYTIFMKVFFKYD
ncbi:MAG: carboxypeptidase-like regulatory domain-containing protein [Ferruginibacter sp.]